MISHGITIFLLCRHLLSRDLQTPIRFYTDKSESMYKSSDSHRSIFQYPDHKYPFCIIELCGRQNLSTIL